MNPSTASGRLVKDLLFKFVEDSGILCFRCGTAMSRDTFSIEHKTPWLDSENPRGLFFDLDNISFSHKSCNYASARRYKAEVIHGTSNGYDYHKCRCEDCSKAKSIRSKEYKDRRKRDKGLSPN